MKNIKSYLIAIWAIFMLAGCGESFIDLKPKNQFTAATVLTSLDGVEGSIYGVYERGRNLLESNDISYYRQLQTDIIMPGSHLNDQAIPRAFYYMDYQFNGSSNGVRDLWNGYYIGINRANLIIDGIDNLKMEDTQSNRARRDKTLGEAYYFRAYYHYCLITKWGNIVKVESASVDPNAQIVLVGSDQVYPFIIEDLIAAIDLLPEAAEVGTPGRVSKGVARHLLSRAYMDVSEWAKAAEMAEAVCNDSYYKLEPLGQVFSIQNQKNKEIIFSWQFSQNDNTHPQRVSHHWYPLYDRVDGVLRTHEQGGRPWGRVHPNSYYWSLFEPGDKRLDNPGYHKRFWVFDSEDAADLIPEGYMIGDTVTPENVGTAAGIGLPVITPTTNKFFEDGSLGKVVDDAQGYRNIIEFRLAEAYIVAAEALWRDGKQDKALTYINAIRQRAGVADFTSLDQDKILDEHARELGHEGHRWVMLKRMGILVERVKQHNPEAGANMQSFHLNWPIPRTFIDLAKVSQNEGYTE
jgi:starch-binding outer membrane protein, SusD/RagB family